MKKIISAIIAILLVIGTIMIFTTGFNLGLEYTDAKKVTIYIGKDFTLEEAREITNEVFGDQKVRLEKLRPFEDVLSITTREVSDEQIEKLNEAINQKYELENTTEDFVISDLPAAELKDVVLPYIPTILIFVIGLVAYEMIVYHKLGAIKVGLETFLTILLAVILLFTAIEITGLTINSYIIAEILTVEFIAAGVITIFFENRFKKLKVTREAEEKEDKKKEKVEE